jgi:hypothetical protein
VRIQSARPDTLFLGIFAKDNNLHVGNIKYQLVYSRKSYAVMGILKRDAAYRGLGGGISRGQGKSHLVKKASKYQPNRSWSTQKE